MTQFQNKSFSVGMSSKQINDKDWPFNSKPHFYICPTCKKEWFGTTNEEDKRCMDCIVKNKALCNRCGLNYPGKEYYCDKCCQEIRDKQNTCEHDIRREKRCSRDTVGELRCVKCWYKPTRINKAL